MELGCCVYIYMFQCKMYLSHNCSAKSETIVTKNAIHNFLRYLFGQTTNHQQTQKYLQNESTIAFDSLFIKRTDNAPLPNIHFEFSNSGCKQPQRSVLISIVTLI